MGNVSEPSLQEYCDWIVDEKGWSVTGKGNEWGRSTQMISPDGKRRIIEAKTKPKEALNPTYIKRLDHLLGLTSPWNPNLGSARAVPR